jgi:hypothetical protein
MMPPARLYLRSDRYVRFTLLPTDVPKKEAEKPVP